MEGTVGYWICWICWDMQDSLSHCLWITLQSCYDPYFTILNWIMICGCITFIHRLQRKHHCETVRKHLLWDVMQVMPGCYNHCLSQLVQTYQVFILSTSWEDTSIVCRLVWVIFLMTSAFSFCLWADNLEFWHINQVLFFSSLLQSMIAVSMIRKHSNQDH